jgi:hypothetical protein
VEQSRSQEEARRGEASIQRRRGGEPRRKERGGAVEGETREELEGEGRSLLGAYGRARACGRRAVCVR